MTTDERDSKGTTRRSFLGTTALSALALGAFSPSRLFAAGREEIRVGLIGCGGRGTGAAIDCMEADPAVRIVALGDAFKDRLDGCRGELAQRGERGQVADDRCFVGLDAFERVLATDCHMVILATSPGFRAQHFEAAVAAGKHIFTEKPVAVDPVGIRRVMAASDSAEKQGLSIVAGTQRRHQKSYLETIARIRDGAIGEVITGRCYWNQGGLWVREQTPGMSDVEWQLRNWLYFTWLSGDHIVEQHVHNIDVMNWVMGSHPVAASGSGGRQARTDARYGHIFDHFAIELEYPGGKRVLSHCRQIDNTESHVGEAVVGTKGTADPGGSIDGAEKWRFKGERTNPYVQEHVDLIASIRGGAHLNEGRQVAESTLTAIMGRMAAYTGKRVTWDFAMNSKLDLTPQLTGLDGSLAVAPVAIPGRDELV